MSKHSNQPVQPSPPTGFQLPTSHSVQLKPVRPPPSPFPTSLNTSPRENVTPSSPNTSSNNLPPPRQPLQSPTSPNVVRKMPPPPSPSTQQSMPPPPVVQPLQSNLIKKLSPQSSPILPKRIVSSPPLNGLNPSNSNSSNNNQSGGNSLPPPPPIVHLPPPPPQSMLLNTSGGNMPPPQSPTPPRLNNSLGNSNGGIPPPSSPQYSNNGTNTFVNSASSNVSPQLHSQSSSTSYLKPPPPVPTRSASLDPKQMSQFIKTSPSHQSSSSFIPSTGPTMPLPPFVSISPLKRNSIDATNNSSNNTTTNNHPHFSPPSLSPSNSQLNVKRLSTQDLNSMLVNRLQHGLSPPVATPFFDDKILGSAAKSQELKEKRDIEEKERRDRERVKKEKDESEKKEKKDKKGKEDQEKKDKKKKEEQEKLDKKEKKKKEEAEKKLKSSKGDLSGSNGIVNTNIFSNSLEQIMENQRSSHPHLQYPVVLKLLSDGVLNLNGQNAEGIFRITGSGTEVNRLKKQINELDFASIDSCSDPHVLASLLKLWLRELTSPVIPTELYYDCIKSRSKEEVTRIYNSLPEQNKQLLVFLLAFLKNISQPHFAVNSKMDIHNVSMVFSPGLLRCPTTDSNMLLNTQYEKDFIMCLIELSP